MCGRFLLDASIEDIMAHYNIKHNAENLLLNEGDTLPGSSITVVTYKNVPQIQNFTWDYRINESSKNIINARIETIEEKTAFKDSFYSRRCIIPATCFYEWQNIGGSKKKHTISLKNERVFSIGGMYRKFIHKNKEYTGVTIITMPCNSDMEFIHNRMPFIISTEDEKLWLSGSIKDLQPLCKKIVEERNCIELNVTYPKDDYEQISMF